MGPSLSPGQHGAIGAVLVPRPQVSLSQQRDGEELCWQHDAYGASPSTEIQQKLCSHKSLLLHTRLALAAGEL